MPVIGRVGREVHPLADQGHHLLRQRGRGGQAGGLDAHQVDQPRPVLPEHEIPIAPLSRRGLLGPDAGIGPDDLPPFQPRQQPLGLAEKLVQHRLGGGRVCQRLDVLRRGADQKIAVDRRGEMHPQAPCPLLRGRIDRQGQHVPGDLVQDKILPPAGIDAVVPHPGQLRHLGAKEAGGIDQVAGGKSFPARRHLPPAGDGPDLRHGSAEEKRHAVCSGVLRQGHGVEEGVKDARLRGVHGPDAPHLGELGV